MRRLDRAAVTAPSCLDEYQCGTHNWGSVTSEHKAEIRLQLEAMQGRRCAYCEGCLDTFGQHIEHFRRKHVYPHLTFLWRNLFWSCDCLTRCGHYKDHGAGEYDPNDIIDPTSDDPEDYFHFYTDGTIRLRPELTSQQEHRARETLRVFNLCPDTGSLRDIRMTYCLGYKNMGEELAELAADSDEDMVRSFIDEELEKIRGLPFETAIRHTLIPWLLKS